MATSRLPPLSYSTARPRSWVRRNWPRLVVLATLGLLLWWIAVSWSRWSHQISGWYWERRCLAHVTPPGTAVCVSDPAQVAALLGRNPDYARGIGSAIYRPQEFTELLKFGDLPPDQFAIVYLGERRTRGNDRYLLVISADISWGMLRPKIDLPGWVLTAHSMAPPSLWPAANSTSTFCGGSSQAVERPRNGAAVIQAGIPDRIDLSHVSIPFALPGDDRQGLIDAYLLIDGKVQLRCHDSVTADMLRTSPDPYTTRPSTTPSHLR